MRAVVGSIEEEFRKWRRLGERALEQLTDEQVNAPGAGGNSSVAVIVQHVAGNLRSRFTDFLTTDGEKPDRNRDGEFEEPGLTCAGARALWERGFVVALRALAELNDADLARTVTVRTEPCTVAEALQDATQRALMHTLLTRAWHRAGDIEATARHFEAAWRDLPAGGAARAQVLARLAHVRWRTYRDPGVQAWLSRM